MAHMNRVVLLVDMDCFYCQVEEKLNPRLKGKPIAVVQYNAWKGGGIIAVNYEARSKGVTRHMRGDDAKRACPDIELVRVPNVRGKADLTKYREAGKTVAKVLQQFTQLLERASVDEAYLDITEAVKSRMETATAEIKLSQLKNTHVVGSDVMDLIYSLYNSGLHEECNLKLAFGGVIAEEIRAAVLAETGYTCSAGIAHNKILAKLAAGLHKPNQQTILPQQSVKQLYKDLPVKKIRSLGGKFGDTLSEDLGITTMAELEKFSEKELAKRYDEKTAAFLYNIARGVNTAPVTTRLLSKSIGCCKKFPGKSALATVESVQHWLGELAQELAERLEADMDENNRKAKQAVVSFAQEVGGKDVPTSRTFALHSYDAQRVAADAYEIVRKNCLKPSGAFCLKFLGLNASNFGDCQSGTDISAFFKPKISKEEGRNSTESVEPSNFSDSTDDLDENSSDMEFLDVAQNSTRKQVRVSNTGNVSDDSLKHTENSNDSIGNEVCHDAQPEPQPGSSFFKRYLENLRRKSPVARDFNTSRHLEEDEEPEGVESSDQNSNLDFAGPSTSKPLCEACDECGKRIPVEELVSHKDHHLALKIMREEADSYKNPQPQKCAKRKSGGNGTLTTFFTSEAALTGDNSEVCPQCGKRVGVDEFVSHLDYHAARKLHLEMNPVKTVEIAKRNDKGDKKKESKRKESKTTRNGVVSVATFFKPVVN